MRRRTMVVWAAWLSIGCTTPAAWAGKAEWEAHMWAGRVAYQQGDYRTATIRTEAALREAEITFGPEHSDTAMTLNNLAVLYEAQGRYADAEPLYRRSLAIGEKSLGPEHPDVATSFNNLAILYGTQGRYADAELLHRRALAIREKALGPEHPRVAESLNNVAALYRDQGRHTDTEPLLGRALAIWEKALGPEHLGVATVLNNVAVLYATQGRYADAEPLHQRALAIKEKALGPEHPSVATSFNNLAVLHKAQARSAEALAVIRRASAILGKRFQEPTQDEGTGRLAEQGKHSSYFELHVGLLAEAVGREPAATPALTAEAFEVGQYARASDTAAQLARMAARHAAGSDALAARVRARQDLAGRLAALEASLLKELGRPAAQADAARLAELRAEEAARRGELDSLDATMAREYPRYAELARPQPLSLEAAQRLLGAEEALVVFLFAKDEGYVWGLRQGRSHLARLPLTAETLAERVRGLRAQLDLSAGEALLARPFNVASAHALYRELLGPVADVLQGAKHLLVVPDKALTGLPLGVLVTEAPAKSTATLEELRAVPWLAKRVALSTLPAVSSLRALRAFAQGPPAPDPFGGFGDPLLEGQAGQRGKLASATLWRGALADVRALRRLERLPDTAQELRAIARSLKAPESALYLGERASERQVKTLDLARYRNLAFATHGLMAGEFKGLAEPALVLSPPHEPNEVDDGLLSAGEISQLKLNAEWVILSACNTAASDGTPGAEGLSGLAKAFFYAGARALLVSHWAVASEATVGLTTTMFAQAGSGAEKAEALRGAMVAMMNRTDQSHFAHPALWAPFVVVGEGNARWKDGGSARTAGR